MYMKKDANTEERISERAASVMEQGEKKVRTMVSDVEKKIKAGEKQIKQMASTVNKQLHENPWPVVTSVALGCLLAGFLAGTSKRRK